MPNFAFHNFEQLLKHRENTWRTQEKHMENTGKTQGLHNPTITALYRPVCFGKIENIKKYTPNENIFIQNFAFHNFEQLLKHMENTGKTQGKHMENTGKTHGEHLEGSASLSHVCTCIWCNVVAKLLHLCTA